MNSKEISKISPNVPKLPNPVTVQPLSVAQVDFKEKDLSEERCNDTENFQQQQFQQHFQQQFPVPQQLPPPPQQLPIINYHQQYQQQYHQQYNQWAQGAPSVGAPQQQYAAGPQFGHFQAPWTQPPLPEFLDPRESIDLKLIRKTRKKDKRCYTCKPRGKVKKHVINTSSSGVFTFHHDMHKRPVIIVTPIDHIEQLHELSPEHLNDLFKSIADFAKLWNIKGYKTIIDMGEWQTNNHPHFTCKIKIPEKTANRMRRDHFQKLKLEQRYKDREKNDKILGPKPDLVND